MEQGSVDLRSLFNSKSNSRNYSHRVDSEGHRKESCGNVADILEKGLLGHCILCLRKLSEKVALPSSSSVKSKCDRLKEVPKAAATLELVNAFNEVWNHLRSERRKKGYAGGGGDQHINLEDYMKDGNSNSALEIFSSTPFICQFCADAVQGVGKLLKELSSQLKQVVKMITESRRGGKYSWRVEGFEAKLGECSLERDILSQTINLLNSICSSGGISGGFSPVSQMFHEGAGAKTCSSSEERSFQLSPQLSVGEATSPITVKTECSDDDPDLESSRELVGQADDDSNLSDTFKDSDNSKQMDFDCIKSEPEDHGNRQKPNIAHIDPIDAFAPPPPPQLSELISTLKKIQKRGNKFLCPKESCEEMFQAKRNLYIHMQVSHPEEISNLEKNRCTCGKIFRSEELLQKHMKTDTKAHPPEIISKEKRKELERKRSCDMCGKIVMNCNMFKHISKHVGAEYVVKCPNQQCIKVFSNSTALKHHLTRLTVCQQEAERQNIGLSCETCGFKAEHRIALRTHVEHVHEMGAEKTINCPISGCVKMFSVRQAVDLHLYSHNLRKVKTQKCEHCSEEMKFEKMEDHLKTSHDAKDVIKCQQCPFQFSLRDNLLQHLRQHRHAGLSCDIFNDGVKFILFADFRDHYHSVHKVGQKKWTCKQCNAAFWVNCSLISHIRKKHSESIKSSEKTKKKNYLCDLCDSVSFASKYGFQDHKIKIHGDKPYTCDRCGDTFEQWRKFSMHKREHGGANLRNFKCEVEGCGKLFKYKSLWKRHKMVGHGGGGKNYVCDICGKAYYDVSTLRYHHDIVHLGLRPFVCEECGESFVNQLVLRNHQRIHSGERPFACGICDQRFRYKVVLQKHLEGHEKKGAAFKPNGPMKKNRKRRVISNLTT